LDHGRRAQPDAVEPVLAALPHHVDQLVDQRLLGGAVGRLDERLGQLGARQPGDGDLGAAEVEADDLGHCGAPVKYRRLAAASSTSTVMDFASGTSSDDGVAGSGSAPGPKARAMASALESPVARKTICRVRTSVGIVIEMRGTN